MLSLAYYQPVIPTTQLQPQLLYKHTSGYYILLGCNNQLQFREGHPTWAMIFQILLQPLLTHDELPETDPSLTSFV